MAYSVPYNSFAPNPVTRDGKTLQPPVAGTVPRGFQPFRYAATPEDGAAGRPRAAQSRCRRAREALAQGRALYETFCLVCHGEQGRGDGPLVPRIPNPPAYTSERVRAMAPGQIFHVISRGSGRMPSYAAQIPYEQRWLIVLYVERAASSAEPRRHDGRRPDRAPAAVARGALALAGSARSRSPPALRGRRRGRGRTCSWPNIYLLSMALSGALFISMQYLSGARLVGRAAPRSPKP